MIDIKVPNALNLHLFEKSQNIYCMLFISELKELSKLKKNIFIHNLIFYIIKDIIVMIYIIFQNFIKLSIINFVFLIF